MPGLDESVDGLLLMAHHAKAGAEGAFLPHTQTLDWEDFRINGQSVGEIGIDGAKIDFDGAHYRTDIGHRAMKRSG